MRAESDCSVSERTLLERAAAGDQRAFAALVRGFDHGLRALAYRLLGDRHEMDDVLQDAYVKAFVGLPRFRGESSPRTWFYRIVYNTCLDQLKRRQPQTSELHSDLGAATSDPVELVTMRAALEDALAALAPIERAAVLLVDAEDLSYEDAATIVGVPTGTMASRLSRARGALRRSLRNDLEGVSQ